LIEQSFQQLYGTGGMRRVHLLKSNTAKRAPDSPYRLQSEFILRHVPARPCAVTVLLFHPGTRKPIALHPLGFPVQEQLYGVAFRSDSRVSVSVAPPWQPE
jgi:hypothetical protein